MGVTVPVDYDTNGADLDQQMTRDVTKAGDKAGSAGGKSLGKSLIKGLAALEIGRQIGGFLTDSLGEAREAQKVGALTANVIKTTGGAAKISAQQVGDLSTAISNKVGIDDEAIQSGANLLLTFKNVRNEAGKGSKIFDRATKAAVDLSASGFGDLTGTSKQLGKALNDPIKGITALGRSGVTFSDDQKAAIKAMVESNNLLGAQKIILREVEAQVKGSAEAQATSADKARVAFGNLKEQVGTALLPVIDDLADVTANKLIPAVSEFISDFQQGVGPAGEFRDVLEDTGDVILDVVDAGKGVVQFFSGLPGPVKKAAIELGIAYVALRQVQSITRSVGGSGLGTFVSGLTNAETRLDTVAGASNRLGAGLRNIAGAGGLLLLQRSLSETSTELGFFEGAIGGALTGFALSGGNPIGALVGGLTGGLIPALKDTNHEAQVATQSFSDYGDSLKDVTGASTAATRALILQDAQQNGLLEKSRALGISDRLLVRGIANTGGAREKLINILRTQNQEIDASAEAQRKAIIAQDLGARATQIALFALDSYTTAAKGQTGAILQQIGAVDKNRLKQLEANVALAEGKDAIIAAKKALSDYVNQNGVATIGLKGDKPTQDKIAAVKAAAQDVARTWLVTVDADNRDALAKIRAVIAAANSVAHSWVGGNGSPPKPMKHGRGSTAPSVTTAPSITTAPSSVGAPVVINQNYYGPTTSRGRVSEMEWSIQYGTRARGAA